MAFSYIDIFAGAGGLSEGFRRNGYIPVAHVEMKKEACLTLKTRECFYYLNEHGRIEDYKRYLRKEITRDDLYEMVPKRVLNSVINETMSEEGMSALFDRIDHFMEIQGIENVDVLVGGPPCQAYSLVGRARSKTNMVGDPRNYLYMLYKDGLGEAELQNMTIKGLDVVEAEKLFSKCAYGDKKSILDQQYVKDLHDENSK